MTFSRKVASAAVLLLVMAIATGGGGLFAAETVRTWTDSTETFSVRAKIVGFENGVVRLTKEDGAKVSLPLARLSAADQAYVRAYDASNPFRPRSAPPATGTLTPLPTGSGFSGASSTPSGPAASSVGAIGQGVISGPQVVWADVPKLRLSSGTVPLSVSLSPAVSLSPIYQRSFALPSGQAFERLGGLWLDGQTASGLLGLWYEPTERAVSTRVMRIDLAAGRAEKPVDLPTGATPIGWDGEGRRVVVRDLARGGSSGAFLGVLRLDETSCEWLVSIQPFDPAQGFEQTVWAAFFQGDRLATLSDTGRFVIWSLTTGKALAYEQLQPDAAVRRSEDGRVVAFAMGSTVHFVDVTNLSPVGCLSDLKGPRAIAFSPDGTKVAVRAQNGGVWNLADMTRMAKIDGSTVRGPMFFADSRSLFDGDRMLDTAAGVRIFQIKGSIGPSGGAGDRAWFVFEEKSKKTRMLHPENPRPSKTDEKIAAMGPEPKGFILPPNQPIRIDVKLLPKNEDRAKVKAHLEESVRKAGHEIDENATMTLVASAWEQDEPTFYPYFHLRDRTWDDVYGQPGSGGRLGGGFNSGGFEGFTRPPGFGIGPSPGFPGFADGPGGPGGQIIEGVTIYAFFVMEMELELDYLGETLWSTKAIPMQNRNRLEIPQGYTVEDLVKRLASDDLQTFLTMSVPKSISRTSAHSRPACGYFELSLSGLVPSKEKKPDTKK
ncbi:MAG TPA: SHD1 domain-containing protein [Pirellulaceae bacterium]|jgi:hypothetical protein|nr:SHD1 domain-containing protein [Pirellulaceae bacterium]